MEMLTEFLIEDAWIVVAVLLVVGKIVKETPKVKDWLIPYVLLILGVVGTVSILGFTPDAVFQGVLAAGLAVFGNQLYKQATDKE